MKLIKYVVFLFIIINMTILISCTEYMGSVSGIVIILSHSMMEIIQMLYLFMKVHILSRAIHYGNTVEANLYDAYLALISAGIVH